MIQNDMRQARKAYRVTDGLRGFRAWARVHYAGLPCVGKLARIVG